MTRSLILSTIVLSFLASTLIAGEWTASVFAGNGTRGFSGDGGKAVDAELNNPFGIVRGPDGALYICDTGNHAIRRVDSDGTITTWAGKGGKSGYTGDGAAATSALLFEPYEVRFDKEGNCVFVEMKNHIVRKVDRKGIISTIAGTGDEGFSGDGGPAGAATFKRPHSIQFGPNRDLYICDIGNHRIRRVDHKTGVITTFSGNGKRGPTVDGAKFAGMPLNGPRAIDFDSEGNLWLALREGNAVFRFNLESGTLHHVAGTGKKGFGGHDGPARDAPLSGPKGVSVGGQRVFLADTESHSIRMIDGAAQPAQLRLVAGDGKMGPGGAGTAKLCQMARPHGVFVDSDGAVLVGDSGNNRIWRLAEKRLKKE